MKHRWPAAVALLGLLVAGCGSNGTASGSGSPSPSTGAPQCDFTATPNQPAPPGHDVGVPAAAAPRGGTVAVTLHTSQGDMGLSLPRAMAPCTVASFAFLAGKHYFDNSPCHRLTAASSLKVLQCGDPTGTGTGGPGYTIPDENPTNLQSVGSGASLYARGMLAMANTGQPHSGGSQFFLVYADSMLPPQYAVFGTVDQAGLAVLDKIAKAGVAGSDPTDGKPTLSVTITSANVN
jgi:cyclophilin family peptidyl-prolyl cis-trans isomerase